MKLSLKILTFMQNTYAAKYEYQDLERRLDINIRTEYEVKNCYDHIVTNHQTLIGKIQNHVYRFFPYS